MMTVPSLIRAALTAGLVLLLVACGSRVELMASMPEAEANEVMAALQNAGIEAQKVPGKDGMVGLTLDASQVGRAVDLLRAKGLPRERFAGMGDVFRKEGLISSPLEERARYLYALSQELGATLTQIDGVIVARVHVVLPERGSPGDPNTPSSAAVFIKHQVGYNLDTVLPQVRRLVTNSIPGLTPEKVSIVLVAAMGTDGKVSPGPVASAAQDGAGASGVPVAAVVGLVLLLLLSLGAAGFLAWKFWWPARAARLNAPKAG
ncbi:MAG: type III secretion inner membrane ring lipoprotein SctJ [Polaromonas sp.]|nr:type III secretion inner membrane ring lipoprotein SctJ [Polaromonas sp.]